MKGLLRTTLLGICIAFGFEVSAQIVQPFAIRYQTNQKGGITFVANTALTCNPSTNGCNTATSFNTASSGSNTNNNNNWTMQYVDNDGNASTFMSSSDSLNLPQCSEISWAGLYWCASNTNGSNSTPTGWANRSQCKFKVNNGAYQTLTADQIVNSSTGYLSYFCYKNVTSIVQAAGTKARFTLADMICWTGGQNFAGGWNLVVVYKNINMTDRNLTVFDGLAVVSSGNNTTVPINGFVTPLSGPVNFELGVVTLDGDRGSTGDQLSFNGVANNYVNVTDAMHIASNSFNSSICYNGAFTPFRLPNYNNTLGYDANIYVPNNAAKNYIGNASTSANIRLSTNTDIVMAQVITSAIDIYQPDLRATLSINDLNGGQVMANDILEYTIKCVNIGSDTSINTFVVDTLDIRTNLIPGTLQVLYGPNTGFKSDALADDQGEYNPANRTVKFRIGTGANGINGGQVNNSVQGTDSTLVRFRVQVIDDCLILNCDSTLTNLAYIYGTGNISGALYTNNGTPNTYDAFGCPTNVNSSVVFHTVGCPPAVISNNGPVCSGQTLQWTGPTSTFANYSWSGPNSFTSSIQNPSITNSTTAATGNYNLLIGFTGNTCTYNLSSAGTVWPLPTVTSSVTNVSCYNFSNGQIALTPGINTPYTYSWNTGATSNPLTGVPAGNYTATYTDANGCINTTNYTITQPNVFAVSATVTSNYNGQQVSCFGSTNATISSTVTGGTAPYSYSWSNGTTNSNLTNIGAGTYTLTVTDALGCTASTSVTVVNPPSLASVTTITSNYNGQNVSCFGSTNGSASVSASGGTPGYTYFWTPGGSSNSSISNIGAGTYNVTVTDLNGCTSLSSVTLVNPPSLTLSVSISSNYNSQNISCFGGSDGSATATVTGGTAPYTYLWNNGSTTQTASNLSAGTYSVVVTDANGCTRNGTITLVNPPTVTLTANVTSNYNGQQISCFSSTNGTASASATGGVPAYSYSWSNGASTPNITGLGAGTYTVTVTDANGCTQNQSVTINPPNPIVPTANITSNFNGFNVSCFGSNNGTASVSVTGGTPNYTYFWSNFSSQSTASNLSAGTYTVTVTDVNGCTANTSVTLTNPPQLNASALITSNYNGFSVSCFGSTNGSALASASGGTPNYSYSWNNSINTPSNNNIAAGTYTVTVTDQNNCTATASVTLTQPTQISVSSINQNVSCFGGNNGSIDATVIGGVIPYTYLWSNNATLQDINNLSAGSYNLTVTDLNGCSRPYTTTITQPNAPLNLTESHSNVSCFGLSDGSINLNVTGGTAPYTYIWSSGQTTQDIFSLPAGNYNVQVTDANGCVSNLSVIVTQPLAPLSNTASVSSAACFGQTSGTINLTVIGGTGPYVYSWNNGAFTEDLINVSAGNYVVNITDNNGCTSSGAYTIGQPSLPLAISETHQDILCFGTSSGSIDLSVSGGTAPYTYSWNNGSSNQDLSNIPAGTYTVTVTDINGCTSNTTITLSQLFAPLSLSEIHANIACFQGNNGFIDLTVIGGAPNYTYAWSNGGLTQDIGQLTAGSYSVVVTDLYNCTATLNVLLTQPATAIVLTETHIDNSCSAGTTGSINLSVAGGVGPYTYSWNNGATSQDILNLQSGTYVVNVTDALGCVATLSIVIADPTNGIAVTGNITNVDCFGNGTGAIDITVTGGQPGYSYLWNTGSQFQDISSLVTGTYSVNVTDQTGCQYFISFFVDQPDSALTFIPTVQNVICYGQNSGNIYMNVWGGTAPYTFAWSNGISTQSNYNLFAGNYSVLITDANGCSTSFSANVTQPPAALTPFLQPTHVVCFGTNTGAIDLSISGGFSPYTYSWSNGSTNQDLTAIQAGPYSVTIMDSVGCTVTIANTVTQPANALSLAFANTNVSCFGGNNGSINLTPSFGTAPYTYAWSNGAATQDLNNLFPGSYSVLVSDANGCTASINSLISQPANTLSSTLQFTNVTCHNGASGTATAAGLGGTPPYAYTWSNGQTTSFVDSLIAGIYSVVISDANGCTSNQAFAITQPAPLIIQSNNINNLCYGQTSGSIALNVIGGVLPYSYLWNTGATTDSIGGLAAGPYFVTVTDDNGCTATHSDTITQPPSSIALNVLITDNLCFGYATGAIDLTSFGGSAPYQYQWNNGATSQDLQNLTAGTYTIAVIDINGCLITDTFTVNQPPQSAVVTPVIANVSCFGGSNGAVQLSVVGPNPPFSYAWSNGATTEDIFNLVPGAYTNTITDAVGCVTSYTANVTQPAAPLSMVSVDTDVLCFAQNTGSIDLSVFGGVAPYTYVWNNSASTQDIQSLAAGIYSVLITDANGCQATFNTQITQPAAPITSFVATTNVLCFGQSTGAVDLSVNGGTAPYFYNWSNAFTSQDINALPIGFYSVLVTDANGCTHNASANIYQPAAPVNVSTVLTPVSCFNFSDGSIAVTISGGTPSYFLSWSNGATTNTINNLSAGFYALQVTDFNGCTSQWNYTLTQPAGPLLLATTTGATGCFNGNNGIVDLSVVGGTAPYSYNWSNGGTTQDINSLTAGYYSVLVTDANGCTAFIGDTVLQPLPFTSATTLQNINCFAQSTGAIDLSVSGGTAPYSYLWNNGAFTQDLSNLLAGTYSVTITDANNCAITNSVVLSQPLIPTTLSTQPTPPSCFGASDGSIDLTVVSGNASLSYLWSNNQSTQDLNNIPAGTYFVTVTDNLGCIDTLTTVLNQPNTLSVSAILTNPTCVSANNGVIDLTITGGTAPYTFTWLSGQNTEDIANLLQGTYFVSITDTNGCSTTASFTLTDPSPIVASYTFTPPTCFAGTNATIDVTVSGGFAPYSYAWASGPNTQDLVNVGAGNDTLYIVDANNCPFAIATSVTQPDSLQLNFNVTNIACFGNQSGAIDLSVSGGTPSYTYLWSNNITSQDLNNLNIGWYNVLVTDNQGCQISDSVQITSATSPLALTITGTNVSCFNGTNGSVNLTITGGTAPYSINWSNAATTEDLFNLTVGNYIVNVIDANGCNSTASIFITGPVAPLTMSQVVTQVQCLGQNTGSIDISVFGGAFPYAYNWTLNNGNQIATTQDLFNITAGVYNLTITDFNGCSIINSYSITQPSSAALISSNVHPVFCFGDSTGWINASVIGGALPYSFTWSNGVNAEDLYNIPAGTYVLTVTDNIGCVTTASILVAQPSGPLFSNAIINNQSCFGVIDASIDANLIGGTAPYYIAWATGETTALIDTLVIGQYDLHVVDSLGCVLDTTFFITQPNPLLIPGTVVNVACHGDSSAYITALPNGGTAPYSYSWSNGQTTQVDTLIPTGAYVVTVTDANGCVDSALFNVTQPASPISLSTLATNVGCFGASSGIIDLSVAGGTPGYTYLWSNNALTQDIQNLPIGTYTATVTDANGCVDSIQVNLTQPAAPLMAMPNITNAPCFGQNGGSIDLNVAGGTLPYSYFWNTGDTLQDLVGVAAGQYTVVVSDANNCATTLIINITQPQSPINVTLTATQPSCFGYSDGSISALVNGGIPPYSYLWNTNANTNSIINLTSDLYTVTVTDANGCNVQNTIGLAQPDSLIALFNIPDNFGCAPFQAQLINQSIGQYTNVLWTFGNGDVLFTPDTAYYSFNQLGCFDVTLTVTSANGCVASNTANSAICVVPGPVASFYATTPQIDFFSGQVQFVNNSYGIGNDYFWQFGDGSQSTQVNPSHIYSPQNIADYDVMLVAVDTNGCVDTAIQVYQQREIMRLNVPNSFTAGDDGINDNFKPIFSAPDLIKYYEFDIYNRWGEIIFSTKNQYDAWDGKYNGKPCQNGSYTWKIKYIDYENTVKDAHGHVVLLW